MLLDGLYPNCLPEHSLHCRPFSAHSPSTPHPPGPHFSSLSLSSTVPKLFPSHVFDPESSSEEQPCICQIICSHLEGKAPPVLQTLSFCAELQPVNSTRKTLGIYLLCQPYRGYLILPICVEAAPWISLFSQNSVIGFFYLLAIN